MPRNITLFWAGSVATPGDVRHAVVSNHKAEPGFRVVNTRAEGAVQDYSGAMNSAVFCLAPLGMGGNGWGRRVTLAALHGCIPVVAQDGVEQVLTGLIPKEVLWITVSEVDVHAGRLPDLLRAIPQPTIALMQREIACAWPRFLFSSVVGQYADEDGGDDAIASTLLLLARRRRGHVKALTSACADVGVAVARSHCAWGQHHPLCSYPCKDQRRPEPFSWPAGGAQCSSGLAYHQI